MWNCINKTVDYKERGKTMHTVSDIIMDINRGCMANNMQEDRFTYQIIFFFFLGNKGTKHYNYTTYRGLHNALENIIRSHLSLRNSVVIAQTTAVQNEKQVCLQSRSYGFCLEEYFKKINGKYKASNSKYGNLMFAVR